MILNLSPMAIQILNKRYLKKDNEGNVIETPEELFERVVNYVCHDDKKLRDEVLEIMMNLEFLPNSPTLMNAGMNNMLSACFVIPIYDNLESIVHDAGWHQAYIHKLGGGVGMNFSNLRPKGDLIKTTGGVTSGVLGFLKMFDRLSAVIHQGGKRAGANMGILNIDHPEIEDFIQCKVNNKIDYSNFNLSVMVTDEFMNAVENDLNWELKFDDEVCKVVKANYLFDMICESAWSCGCPGMLFEDTINKNNILNQNGMHITTTNPCGEQPLYTGYYNNEIVAESCNLGSINLSKMVDDNNDFDYDRFEHVIRISTRFLDNVIDVNNYPFEFIDKGTKLTRKIGLGITGFSDMLIKRNISYDSHDAIRIADDIMSRVSNISHNESKILAKEKGKYPLADIINDDKRNMMTTTIAPTGSIGRIMNGHGFSLGIEPPYALCMKSNIIETSIDEGIHPLLIKKLEEYNIDYNINDLYEGNIPHEIKHLFLTSSEIPVEQHVKIQAAFQQWIDSAVSKTINLSSDAIVDDFRNAYILAYESGCKGVTIFRDMCKGEQVLVKSNNKKEKESDDIIKENEPIDDLIPRPKMLPAVNFTRKTGCNTLFITLTKPIDNNGVLECFINTSGKGGCRGMQDGLAIVISVYQRYIEGVIGHDHAVNALSIVAEHLSNVTCKSSMIAINKQKSDKVKHPVDSKSCPHAVSQAIKYMLSNDFDKNNEILIKTNDEMDNIINDIKKCPECGTVLIRQEGCSAGLCPVCGYGGCL